MARKVVTLTVQVVVETNNPAIDVDDAISDLDCQVTTITDGVTISSSFICDREYD